MGSRLWGILCSCHSALWFPDLWGILDRCHWAYGFQTYMALCSCHRALGKWSVGRSRRKWETNNKACLNWSVNWRLDHLPEGGRMASSLNTMVNVGCYKRPRICLPAQWMAVFSRRTLDHVTGFNIVLLFLAWMHKVNDGPQVIAFSPL